MIFMLSLIALSAPDICQESPVALFLWLLCGSSYSLYEVLWFLSAEKFQPTHWVWACVRFVCFSVTESREWLLGPMGEEGDTYREQAETAAGLYLSLIHI